MPARVATTDHVYDYLGETAGSPQGFAATGWVDATHVLGTLTATATSASSTSTAFSGSIR